MRVGIVGCASRKKMVRSKAGELYLGRLFEGSMTYAREACDRVFIVSAKHGLVDPEQELDPYDERLPPEGSCEKEEWVKLVIDQVWNCFPPDMLADSSFVVLAGKAYAEPFLELASGGLIEEVVEPLEGLGVGRRYAWLKAWINKGWKEPI